MKGSCEQRRNGAPSPPPADVVGRLRALVTELGSLPAAADDAERIDRIASLEALQGAVAAAQISEIAAFSDSQLAEQRHLGVPARRLGSGIAEQVALARKVSPVTGQHQVAQAKCVGTRAAGDLRPAAPGPGERLGGHLGGP